MDHSAMEAKETTDETQAGSKTSNPQFPYEEQSEHWDVDFANSNEVYEGTALPVWILVGWAAFIIWAIVYLTAGIRTSF